MRRFPTFHWKPSLLSTRAVVVLIILSNLITGANFLFSPLVVTPVHAATETFTTSGTWQAPAGVTSVTAEVWGGGGAGGGATGNPAAGGGGAGGAYARGTVSVTPGNNYSYTVGAVKTGAQNDSQASSTGNPSWFGSTATVYAPGGEGGGPASSNNSNGAAGTGSSTGAIGNQQVYAGGSGTAGVFTSSTGYGGAGGGGAGSTGAGGAASTSTGGTGTSENGGNGANGGGNNTVGADGTNYGGGGSGAKSNNNTNRAGGDGAQGLVRITYNLPPAFTVAPTDSPDPVESGSGVTFAATATDADSDTWKLVVCKTNSVTPGTNPTCAASQDLCVSSSAVASGAENTCTWTSSGSGSQSWYAFACDTASSNPSCSAASTTNSPVSITVPTDFEQEGFRFREDDGSETTATWLAAQDTDITQETNVTTRLRMLIDSVGDAGDEEFQLEYKEAGDPSYTAVAPAGITGPTPVVESVSTGENTTDSSTPNSNTGHPITMPSGVQVGDLILVIISSDGAPGGSAATSEIRIDGGWGTNWVRLAQDESTSVVSGAVFYKFAEGSDSLTVTTSSLEQTSYVAYRISGAATPIATSSNSAGASTSDSDPPNLDTGTERNYLWIAARSGDDQVAASAAPSGYTNLQTVTATNTTGASINTAVSSSTATSENPGTFTSSSEAWVAFTIGVPPVGSGIDGVGTGANTGSSSISVPYPTDIEAGDLLVILTATKPGFPTGSTGFTRYSFATGGAGPDLTDDSGEVTATILAKEADGTETGNATVTTFNPGSFSARMFSIRKDTGTTWDLTGVAGTDTTVDTSWSVTMDSDPDILAGDIIITSTAINTDGNTYKYPSMSTTGVTYGWNTLLFEQGTGNGNDQTLVGSVHGATSGDSTAAPVFTMTSSSSSTNSPAGATAILRIRQVGGGDPDAPIILVDSTNVTASGENTTAQLTAPSGKTTSDFTTGRMQDDENPADAINLAADDYTELEWALQATDVAVNTEVYQFRVTRNGTPLDTYTVTPEWTIGTPGGASPTFSLSAYRWYVDNDSENVTDPWGNPDLAANALIGLVPALMNSPPITSTELRLRVGITVNTNPLTASSQQFKLQYKAGTDASCTTGSWTDMAAGGGGGIWRFATSGVTDGTTLTNIRLTSTSDVLQVYAKANPTATNPNSATAAQDIEYDFHIQHNGASDATTYSFRVVESDDTVFDAYTVCPTLMTAPGTAQLLRHGEVFAEQSKRGKTWAD